MVSLEDSKPLPVQPVREIDQDVVMGDGNSTSSSSSRQNATQHDVVLNTSRQNNILARQQQHVLDTFSVFTVQGS